MHWKSVDLRQFLLYSIAEKHHAVRSLKHSCRAKAVHTNPQKQKNKQNKTNKEPPPQKKKQQQKKTKKNKPKRLTN